MSQLIDDNRMYFGQTVGDVMEQYHRDVSPRQRLALFGARSGETLRLSVPQQQRAAAVRVLGGLSKRGYATELGSPPVDGLCVLTVLRRAKAGADVDVRAPAWLEAAERVMPTFGRYFRTTFGIEARIDPKQLQSVLAHNINAAYAKARSRNPQINPNNAIVVIGYVDIAHRETLDAIVANRQRTTGMQIRLEYLPETVDADTLALLDSQGVIVDIVPNANASADDVMGTDPDGVAAHAGDDASATDPDDVHRPYGATRLPLTLLNRDTGMTAAKTLLVPNENAEVVLSRTGLHGDDITQLITNAGRPGLVSRDQATCAAIRKVKDDWIVTKIGHGVGFPDGRPLTVGMRLALPARLVIKGCILTIGAAA